MADVPLCREEERINLLPSPKIRALMTLLLAASQGVVRRVFAVGQNKGLHSDLSPLPSETALNGAELWLTFFVFL